jgi:HlyD family secretion protein
MRLRSLIVLVVLGVLAAGAWKAGLLAPVAEKWAEKRVEAAKKAKVEPPLPAVTVVHAAKQEFVETVLVTGSFAAREEILVAPEVDGLRVLELKAEEGDYVKKGDLLAVLVAEQIDAQIAANDAALASATAAIAQAESQIKDTEARLAEAKAQLERARPLVKDKYLSESVFDQREQAARSADAQLSVAKSAHAAAEAEKVRVEAQRRELLWRRGNAEVRAPAEGLISKRAGRIGGIATASTLTGGDTMFRIIAKGEVELDAEVAETHLWKVKAGQQAHIAGAGGKEVAGTVRLVSPEVDKATRLGHVRIFLGVHPELKIGSFGRGYIETARRNTIAVPLSAVLYSTTGASVQVVVDGKIDTRPIKTSLEAGGMIAIDEGLAEGDLVVAKAGTFLRDGDFVRAVEPKPRNGEKLSEAQE